MTKELSDAELGVVEYSDPVDTVSLRQDDSSSNHEYDERSEMVTENSSRQAADEVKRGDGSFMIYAVLFIATIVFGAATYLMVASNQTRFDSQFQSYAREFKDIADKNTRNIFGQLDSLASSITSKAIEFYGFPNITMSHFDLRSEQVTKHTGVDMVLFLPFVEKNETVQWESYANKSQNWVTDDYDIRGWDASTLGRAPETIYECSFCDNIARKGVLDEKDSTEEETTDRILSAHGYESDGFHVPVAQFGPGPIDLSLSMFDVFTHPTFKNEILTSLEHDSARILSETTSEMDVFFEFIEGPSKHRNEKWRALMFNPVKENFNSDARTAGYLVAIVSWQAIFDVDLPETVNGINIVVRNDCGSVFTFTANGKGKSTVATGSIHDPRYEDLVVKYPFIPTDEEFDGASKLCQFDLSLYPTDEFRGGFESTDPSIYSGLIVVVFIFIASIFFWYDKYAQRKQDAAILQAKRAEAIVTSVFPKSVGLRLIEQAEKDQSRVSDKKMLNNFLATNGDVGYKRSKPIADLFPSTTVMFADIVGFTAWSSMREPSQVFVLLESIYKEFDTLAKRRKVFKVETVGDCYVAVCGLPEPRKDHAIVMSLFAGECIVRMGVQVQALEVELGPDTADLGIRIGVHSGPVTAGVLRGDRARFQLFGDTVNTCARIESTGMRNRIHISKSTAELLEEMGRSHWFVPRKDKVSAKGKGELETFWLKHIRPGDNPSEVSATVDTRQDSAQEIAKVPKMVKPRSPVRGTIQRKLHNLHPKKLDRLVNWNVDVLMNLLNQVAERRLQAGTIPDSSENMKQLESRLVSNDASNMDEVVEVIKLPRFNTKFSTPLRAKVELEGEVQNQLKVYVSLIASMYNDNPFHNFEHASHVTMSVSKLLSRIVGPDIDGDDAQELHDHTYGITSDPLTQFAVVFSALLHDVDHLGVPNTQLIKEAKELAQKYNNKSIAEQNSIDLAWGLLMEDRFQVLRQAIYSTEAELRRFRQLLVNTILATDIMDKELKSMRNAKWDKAFAVSSSELTSNDNVREITNRKATVVIEHLIQASDVAHTMQHWQVYRKWNARLFKEMYRSYQEGHSEKDPSDGWYEGEMGFFDYYILPLAKKLQDCGVFGVASHEYLNYAEQNRKEWEAKGRSVVADFLKEIQAENELTPSTPLGSHKSYWDWS
eukprot:scaffold5439_cov132-Cylindrotheca_fusiformis.AAC.1